ncbi:MAG: hypothetical protein VXY93_15780, partial [Pseudomonadota bacterium]|nr:hypothetical protein [Pseudomonadota bacterium]
FNFTGLSTHTGNFDLDGDLDVDGHTNLDNISVAGVSTFTGDATFSGNVSIGGTLTYEDVTNVDSVGLLTARSGIRVTGGVIEALAGENKIPSLYSNLAALPSANTYHGMFAHVHSTGRGYFAHAGNWLELVNKDTSGNVGLSGDLDVDGHTNLDNVSIAGVSTFSDDVTFQTANTNNLVLDKSDNSLKFGDSVKAKFGTGSDLEIYHDTAASIIENKNLALNIYSGTDIQLRSQKGAGM